MQKFTRICLALGALGVAALAAPNANAMNLPAAASLNALPHSMNVVTDAAYICRRVWRCSYYGCGWHQRCWWRHGPYYRPWREWWWRHHHWRHRGWWHHRDWDGY